MLKAIEVINIYKSYGRVRALRGLTFSVPEGEIYGLLGPNGAGKTTTLKILVGLLTPDRGKALIMGYDVTKDRVAALSNVGYMPENPILFRNLTVKEFLEMVGALRGMKKEEVDEAINYYLDLFGMKDKLDEPASALSRGMTQKVLATAALMVKPRVLIMDEPMAGMDPESQHAFKEEIRRLSREGVTSLISSHILDMVERLCTKVGIIDRGRLVAEGTLEELRGITGREELEEVFLKLVREGGEDSNSG